jgi:hypothetical protein
VTFEKQTLTYQFATSYFLTFLPITYLNFAHIRPCGSAKSLPLLSLRMLGSAGRMAVSEPVFRKGVEYLLGT